MSAEELESIDKTMTKMATLAPTTEESAMRNRHGSRLSREYQNPTVTPSFTGSPSGNGGAGGITRDFQVSAVASTSATMNPPGNGITRDFQVPVPATTPSVTMNPTGNAGGGITRDFQVPTSNTAPGDSSMTRDLPASADNGSQQMASVGTITKVTRNTDEPKCEGYDGAFHSVGEKVHHPQWDYCLYEDTLVRAIDVCFNFGDYIDWEYADEETKCAEGEICTTVDDTGFCERQQGTTSSPTNPPTKSPTRSPTKTPTGTPTQGEAGGYKTDASVQRGPGQGADEGNQYKTTAVVQRGNSDWTPGNGPEYKTAASVERDAGGGADNEAEYKTTATVQRANSGNVHGADDAHQYKTDASVQRGSNGGANDGTEFKTTAGVERSDGSSLQQGDDTNQYKTDASVQRDTNREVDNEAQFETTAGVQGRDDGNTVDAHQYSAIASVQRGDRDNPNTADTANQYRTTAGVERDRSDPVQATDAVGIDGLFAGNGAFSAENKAETNSEPEAAVTASVSRNGKNKKRSSALKDDALDAKDKDKVTATASRGDATSNNIESSAMNGATVARAQASAAITSASVSRSTPTPPTTKVTKVARPPT